MHVLAFCGYSGSGKTTLMEQLIGRIRSAGKRVSVVKHAHHAFDIDHVGKDSWRHRQAGAYEVLIASDRRLAKVREYERTREPTIEKLLAELSECDWVLVEGFRSAPLPKIETWRASTGKSVQYPADPRIIAVATDDPKLLPQPTRLPVLDLNDIDAIADFVLSKAHRWTYPTAWSAARADAPAFNGRD